MANGLVRCFAFSVFDEKPDGAIFELVSYNPQLDADGYPYTLVWTDGERTAIEQFHTREEALDRRDQLFDEGALNVLILGLPTVAAGGLVN